MIFTPLKISMIDYYDHDGSHGSRGLINKGVIRQYMCMPVNTYIDISHLTIKEAMSKIISP